MTTVWTASNLRRQDGQHYYNSLSRSLGSLMSIVLDEQKSPSVLIFSNQHSPNNLQPSVSVGERLTDHHYHEDKNIPSLYNQFSFQSLQTDSSSSIAFVGKKIKREYQSAFVLPDNRTIGIIRQEEFMTEEGLAQVTLSLCISMHLDNLKSSHSEKIGDYLKNDYLASILLASQESYDTELLGYMSNEYTSRKPNRFNFERSESRRRKREIILVQEEIIEDNDDAVLNSYLPEQIRIYEKLSPEGRDEVDLPKSPIIQHPPPPLPPPTSQPIESPAVPTPPKTFKISDKNHTSPKSPLIQSKVSSSPQKQPAPIIGRAEPPGKTKSIVSSPKSKENFEQLKRQWNNRIAQMQEHLDNQYRDTPPTTTATTTSAPTYTEGHRGSVVTSILPTVDKRSSDPIVKSRIPPADPRFSSPEQTYDHRSPIPEDRNTIDRHGSNKENLIDDHFDYIRSLSPARGGSGDLVDPVTERCEKDAQFIYSQSRLFVNQQNIGRLSPRKLSVDRDDRHITTTTTTTTTPSRRDKLIDENAGHRRHPPPPLSPTSKEGIHYPRDATANRPRIPDTSKTAMPTTPIRQSTRNLDDELEKRKSRPKLYDDELLPHGTHGEPVSFDPRRSSATFHYDILQHPDEYNYLAEAEKQKPFMDFTSELSYDSSLFGKTSQGSTRKQPPIRHYDKYKEKKPERSRRHPPPPLPQPTDHDRPKHFDDKSSPKADRRAGRGVTADNYPPVQLRRPPKGQKTGQSIPSFRDSFLSPEGMSMPSTPRYDNTYGVYYDDKTGKYIEALDREHFKRLSPERISRPRSKHTTATSRSSGYYGATVVTDASSKHSLIISTKRRTLSGLTGTHPSKHRSSSMNTLWFGDHPVPSERTLSPSTPIRLSNIQIQAQAEIDRRRHRSSSSYGHSLDRKSQYSTTGWTESCLSKGFNDLNNHGYQGIGYTYDNRGRLIHGGACLPERSASRKRRLLDGHESLSRIWIPQGTERYPAKQISDKTASLLTNRDERQTQLDNSAMAFALRNFTVPKIRQTKSLQKINDLPKSPYTINNNRSTIGILDNEHWQSMISASKKLWRSCDTVLCKSIKTLDSDHDSSWLLYLNYSTKYLHETAI
ncbi:unnamed protein product [Schistosoma turkestanicum]|nr:unnamed protein product [Schistosoma turkestanicum]